MTNTTNTPATALPAVWRRNQQGDLYRDDVPPSPIHATLWLTTRGAQADVTLELKGGTYPHRDTLRQHGFTYNPNETAPRESSWTLRLAGEGGPIVKRLTDLSVELGVTHIAVIRSLNA